MVVDFNGTFYFAFIAYTGFLEWFSRGKVKGLIGICLGICVYCLENVLQDENIYLRENCQKYLLNGIFYLNIYEH